MLCCLQGDNTTTFATNWFAAHVAAATALNKPLILEEMGKQYNVTTCNDQACRLATLTPFYTAAYQTFNTSYYSGGPFQGIMFWRLINGPTPDSNAVGATLGDGLGVDYTEPLFTQTILPNSKAALTFATAKNAANCTPTVSASLLMLFSLVAAYVSGPCQVPLMVGRLCVCSHCSLWWAASVSGPCQVPLTLPKGAGFCICLFVGKLVQNGALFSYAASAASDANLPLL